MIMKRKFMLCQYPAQGFGGMSGEFYLLDVFGNRYEIKDAYDKVLGEMYKVVKINDSFYGTYSADTVEGLVEAVEIALGTKIVKW